MPVAHLGLAAGLDLKTYSNWAGERLSIQRCRPAAGSADERLAPPGEGGREAAYVFAFPNLLANRYGGWLDTNVVLPRGPDSCVVRYDWFVEPRLAGDAKLVARGVEASERVQLEDTALCEAVQAGLASGAYEGGRYAPIERLAHHFHRLLHADLTGAAEGEGGGAV